MVLVLEWFCALLCDSFVHYPGTVFAQFCAILGHICLPHCVLLWVTFLAWLPRPNCGSPQCRLNLLAHRQKMPGPTKAHPMPRPVSRTKAPGGQRTHTLKKKYNLQKKCAKHCICSCSFCHVSFRHICMVQKRAGACKDQEFCIKM